ncbi:hypothetical protein VNO77_39614 [Canavalia gladiata]|uniref:Uncharacterized protein n=1 Tax=Canavalia gladiata TaxID=3824 RepID=A0AAN9JX09_CANGL
MHLDWSFDTHDPKYGPSLSLSLFSSAKLNLYLFTMIVRDDYIYIRRHIQGDHNNLLWHSQHQKPLVTETSTVHFEVEVEGRKIRKFGWHVVRKDDHYEDMQIKWLRIPCISN